MGEQAQGKVGSRPGRRIFQKGTPASSVLGADISEFFRRLFIAQSPLCSFQVIWNIGLSCSPAGVDR